MIYKKDANFPYPILTNTSNAYSKSKFILNIDFKELGDNYCFEPKYDISSDFIKSQIENKKAELILVVQNKDTKFYKIDDVEREVTIPQERLSIKDKTVIQLLINSNQDTNTSATILWVTIGVCVAIGIALGIILGRKSAMK